MTIYWDPVEDDTDPDTIDVWWVGSGNQTKMGTADVSGVNGMPDSVGGVIPDAARIVAVDYYDEQQNAGVLRDILAMDYVRGTP